MQVAVDAALDRRRCLSGVEDLSRGDPNGQARRAHSWRDDVVGSRRAVLRGRSADSASRQRSIRSSAHRQAVGSPSRDVLRSHCDEQHDRCEQRGASVTHLQVPGCDCPGCSDPVMREVEVLSSWSITGDGVVRIVASTRVMSRVRTRRSPSSDRICSRCCEAGHDKRNCPLKALPQATKRKCSICREPGHYSRTCPRGATA